MYLSTIPYTLFRCATAHIVYNIPAYETCIVLFVTIIIVVETYLPWNGNGDDNGAVVYCVHFSLFSLCLFLITLFVYNNNDNNHNDSRSDTHAMLFRFSLFYSFIEILSILFNLLMSKARLM